MDTILEPIMRIIYLATTMVFERLPSEHSNPILPYICMAVAVELAEKHSELFTTPFFWEDVCWEDVCVDDNFGTFVEYQERDIEVKNTLDTNRPYTDKMWNKYNYLYSVYSNKGVN